jgi:hypothetical protein
MKNIESISPARFERLRSCALRVDLELESPGSGRKIITSNAQLIGLIFHKSFELYLGSKSLSPYACWEAAIAEISAMYSRELYVDDYRRQMLFFERRVLDIDNLLKEHENERGSETVLTEFNCSSSDGKIRGVIDLFIDGNVPVIVDFKTGINSELELISPMVQRQLALYGIIIRELRGVFPKIFVCGMKTKPYELLDIDFNSVHFEVESLVNEFNVGVRRTTANATFDACRFCIQKGRCAEVWKDHDLCKKIGSLSGKVATSPLLARNGLANIQLQTGGELFSSVRDVPSVKVQRIGVDAYCRFWDLKPLTDDGLSYAWVNGRSQIVEVH